MSEALPVNEIFETIQGEATFTGTPSVFLRLQGCPVGCPWCDTKHTWHINADDERSISEVTAKTKDGASYAFMDADDLLSYIRATFTARHIVITGGEPAIHDLQPLSSKLIVNGYRVQLETSGTYPIRIDHRAFVTLSPKIDMPGGLKVRADALARANEIKMPVGKLDDIAKLEALIRQVKSVLPSIWLQPLSQSPKATQLCIHTAISRNWHLSVQSHKYIGVR
jgi:7-carboxy-7-deazaguanine synthase